MIYHFPPTVTDNAIEYAPIQGVIPPRTHIGYRKDKANPWRQISEWEPCSKRVADMRPRACGRALISYTCMCEGCPLYKHMLGPVDCDGCKHTVNPTVTH